MPLTITCPQCGQVGKVPDETAGRRVKCPRCQTHIDTSPVPEMEKVTPKWVRFLMLFALAAFILMVLIAIIGKDKVFPHPP